ncbi:MAG: hypothetical protein IJU96_02875 [Clostridia bacterium]|nr:hypothetical protein [Clostridia bacterium]
MAKRLPGINKGKHQGKHFQPKMKPQFSKLESGSKKKKRLEIAIISRRFDGPSGET